MSANFCERTEIRTMGQTDLDDVLVIEKQSFAAPWSRRLFQETMAFPLSRNYVLATELKKTVGYANFYVVQHEAHMLNIAVHPDYRRKGCATHLLDGILGDLGDKGVREVYLEVRESNSDAIALYLKFGFEFIGRRKRYYVETNEDALVMRLFLDKD